MCKFINIYTLKHQSDTRTNIVIDDDLIEEAMRVSRINTKKEAVREGLKLLIQRKKQERIRNLRGKLSSCFL